MFRSTEHKRRSPRHAPPASSRRPAAAGYWLPATGYWLRRGLFSLPTAVAVVTVLALSVGYRYADLTHHRRPLPAPAGPQPWRGAMVLAGTLSGYSQRVMSIRTAHGTFAVILAQTTVALPRCGHEPTLQPGERLVVRVPGRGDGTLLARTVQDAGPCPR